MSEYVYNDEDNEPMIGIHPPWRISPEGKIVFMEKSEPTDTTKYGCWCCREFDGDRCMKEWNNADPDYYIPWRDDRQPNEICDDFEIDEDTWRAEHE